MFDLKLFYSRMRGVLLLGTSTVLGMISLVDSEKKELVRRRV